MKRTIGIDYDSVLANTTEVWLGLLNEYLGTEICLDDIKEWNIAKAFPPENEKLVFDMPLNPLMWERITPLPGSKEIMRKLCEEFDVYVVTATEHRVAEVKTEWLLREYPFLDPRNIIMTKKKHMVDVELLLDDNTENLISGKYKRVVLDYPWNRDVDDEANSITRVKDWYEAYDAIVRLMR